MGSSSEMISSVRGSTPLMPGRIVVAFDATENRNIHELKDIIRNILMSNDMIQEADAITVFGVLYKVLHPMGFEIQIISGSDVGNHARAVKEDVSRKIDASVSMLGHSAAEWENEECELDVKIAAGAPMRMVVIQEIVSSNATWAVLDRQLKIDLKFYLKHIPCKVALVHDDFSLEILRPYCSDKSRDFIQQKLLYSLSKPVRLPHAQDNERDGHSISLSASSSGSSDIHKSNLVSSYIPCTKENVFHDEFGSVCQRETSGSNELENGNEKSPDVMQTQGRFKNHFEGPVSMAAGGLRKKRYPVNCSYPDIHMATDGFLSDNFLGQGGYGDVYKGQLENGQLIAAKVKSEVAMQGFTEFQSEVDVLCSVRHKNIVMLLCFWGSETRSILVYEYIENRSLEWHLFDNTDHVLHWKRRQAIAIGTAKGLRFIHEECRGSPIIHRDMRSSNILLTQDFVPLVGDCGLTKWKAKNHNETTSILNLEYLAPEYRENGVCSVSTDVYAFGIILIQLISGRKIGNCTKEDQTQSLRQWELAIKELVDPRLGDMYSMHELYQMATTAYLCVQTKPTMRPTMGEARLLECENDHLRLSVDQLMRDTQRSLN